MTSGKFSLQWVNDNTHQKSMNTAVFTLRDTLNPYTGDGGLTCERLHLDQVHIHFRPTTEIGTAEYRTGDNTDLDWRAETQQLYVRLNPGVRYVLYTDGTSNIRTEETGRHTQRSLVYSAALSVGPGTGLSSEDVWVRTYRPVRDLPVLTHVANLSELQVDLLWPLLQGDSGAAWWSVPDYRILRVIAEFSFAS